MRWVLPVLGLGFLLGSHCGDIPRNTNIEDRTSDKIYSSEAQAYDVEEVAELDESGFDSSDTPQTPVYSNGHRIIFGSPIRRSYFGSVEDLGAVYLVVDRDSRTGVVRMVYADPYQTPESFILQDLDEEEGFNRIIINPGVDDVDNLPISPHNIRREFYVGGQKTHFIENGESGFEEYYNRIAELLKLLENNEHQDVDFSPLTCDSGIECHGKSYREGNMPFFGTTEIHIHRNSNSGRVEEATVHIVYHNQFFRIEDADDKEGFDRVILFPEFGDLEGRSRIIDSADEEFKNFADKTEKILLLLEKPRYERK